MEIEASHYGSRAEMDADIQKRVANKELSDQDVITGNHMDLARLQINETSKIYGVGVREHKPLPKPKPETKT